jgi:hypothetical protein
MFSIILTFFLTAEDKWLIMKGLDGPTGKDFFSKFESSHKCFIQVSNDGVINFTRPRY